MNMLTNISLPQLDEAGLLSPLEDINTVPSRAAIRAGINRGRVLRAQAFHAAVGRLRDGLKRLLGANRR